MDLSFSPEEEAFRQEVRAFIAEARPKLPSTVGAPEAATRSKEDYLAWHKLLYKKGWVAPLWPKQYGGTGWNVTQRYIFNEEVANAEMPTTLPFGLSMVAPVIFTFGNDEQKQKYLPRILSGEDWWCQGYSEPGSGSDLASLRTKAVREGDFYIVNGQKTWTTLAQFADMIFCLVRTDPNVKQQEGITFLLIDMKTPGITVKPIIVLDGAHEVNEVFFDNVKVPVANRVGEENKGWTYAKFLLVNERSGIAGTARSKKGDAAAEGYRPRRDAGRRALDRGRGFRAQDRRSRNRPRGAGIYRAAHPGAGIQGPYGGSGKLDPQDPRHGNPAAHHRADGRGDRLLRLSQ